MSKKQKSPKIEKTEEKVQETPKVEEVVETEEEKKRKLEKSGKVYKGKFFDSAQGKVVEIYE